MRRVSTWKKFCCYNNEVGEVSKNEVVPRQVCKQVSGSKDSVGKQILENANAMFSPRTPCLVRTCSSTKWNFMWHHWNQRVVKIYGSPYLTVSMSGPCLMELSELAIEPISWLLERISKIKLQYSIMAEM